MVKNTVSVLAVDLTGAEVLDKIKTYHANASMYQYKGINVKVLDIGGKDLNTSESYQYIKIVRVGYSEDHTLITAVKMFKEFVREFQLLLT